MIGANAYGNDAGRQYTVRVSAAGFLPGTQALTGRVTGL